MSLTERQRKAIIERDEGTSQMRHYSEQKGFHRMKAEDCVDCDGKGCGLQVHHIQPQRTEGADEPENLITVYQCEHNGKKAKGAFADPATEFVIHPDMIETFQNYRKGDKRAFIKLSEQRNQKLASGVIYWNADHDEEMAETAKERTDTAISKGWRFPKLFKRGT